jgi:predicted RNase H-like HicB family nuclease
MSIGIWGGFEVHTQGKDLDEARAMVEDAIKVVLADRRERGKPLPETGWAIAKPIDLTAA